MRLRNTKANPADSRIGFCAQGPGSARV